jgi:hypothetical protein
MRRTVEDGNTGGRPSRTPAARFAARPSFVCSPMILRSHWARVTIMFANISPVGVDVSTPRSSTTSSHPLSLARSSMNLAKSDTDRESRSSFDTTSRSPSSADSDAIAESRPGRRFMVFPEATSSWMPTSFHPRCFASRQIARRCASRPAPEVPCSSVLTLTYPTALVTTKTYTKRTFREWRPLACDPIGRREHRHRPDLI